MTIYEEFARIQIQLEQMQNQANQLLQRKNQLAQQIIQEEQKKQADTMAKKVSDKTISETKDIKENGK